ncbi:MAG: GTP 3',8-cyclase MoaA, partial [bacterium]
RPMKSLRLSVTDRCNLACSYCMPEKGPDELSPREEILSYEELQTLTSIFIDMGVDNVRITGGEPLLRNELYKLVEMLSDLNGLEEITLTTNGFYLPGRIDKLTNSGLDRINFSLDSLQKERFNKITRRNAYEQVMDGLDTLLATPSLHPIKLNVVPMKGINDDELNDFVQWALDHQQHVRFIEYMPLEGGYDWSEEKVILAPEMKSIISEKFELQPRNDSDHSTAKTFIIEDSQATVGFITSVSDPFCGSCDRVRLTAEGQIKNCLFAYEEDDLRTLLRNGAGTRKIKDAIRDNYLDKWEGGCVKLQKGEYEPDRISRTMSRVGG